MGERRRMGQDHHRAKLTDQEVALIRKLKSLGMQGKQIAEKFGVSAGYVSRVCSYGLRAFGGGRG